MPRSPNAAARRLIGIIEERPPEIAYTGDPEADCAAELDAVKSSFQQRAEHETRRRKKATESGYWICLCFQTQAQADAFALAATGKTDRFADGVRAARTLRIEIPADDTPFGPGPRIDRKWANISLR